MEIVKAEATVHIGSMTYVNAGPYAYDPIIKNNADSSSIAPPEGGAYFHHPTGRLSDGRVVLDFICECSLSLALLTALLHHPCHLCCS
jgi:hypothetical protein